MNEFDESRFVSGIYNYCDRWCERCPFVDRCYLYHKDQKRIEEHLWRGEDPDDPEVAMKDVGDSLREAMGMLIKMCEEAGVDIEAAGAAGEEDDEPEDSLPGEAEPLPRRRGGLREFAEHPLYGRVECYCQRITVLLRAVRAELPQVGERLIEQLSAGELEDPEATVDSLTAVRDAYELLARYRYFLAVKTLRALGSLEEAESERDRDYATFSRNDALGTAKLVHECCGKTVDALWRIGELNRPFMELTMPIAMEGDAILRDFDTYFPEHRSFRRPGLDELR